MHKLEETYTLSNVNLTTKRTVVDFNAYNSTKVQSSAPQLTNVYLDNETKVKTDSDSHRQRKVD